MFPKYVLLSICAFIRVHFGRPGKFHSIHPSGVYTFFFQKLAMISEFFFKEKLEVISFQKHVGFSARQLIFSFSTFFLTCLLLFSYLLSFSLLALFFPFCSLFHFIFFSFLFLFLSWSFLFILHIYFWTMFLNEELYTVPEFQTPSIVMIYKH